MRTVLALDQGTTGSTALVVGVDGTILGRGYHEFAQHFPEPGLVEHDAEEILRVTVEAAKDAMAEARITPDAVGITNQRETVVAWDRATGQPLHHAIVWQDRRTAERCDQLRNELGDQFVAERTGLVWDPYFSGTKLEWMLRHVPGLREKVEGGDAVFGTIDAWLIFRLTGGASFVTDHTNASRTLLYNLDTQSWDAELMSLFGVPTYALPEIRSSSGVVGSSRSEVLGLDAPIAGIAGDQQAALFGQGAWTPGHAKCTYGTGAFLLMQVGAERPGAGDHRSGTLTTMACGERGEPAYALEGAIFIAGAAIQWLRDGLGILARASESEAMASAVDDTAGVYFVPALVGLGAPHWEPDARGTIFGLTRGTRREHLVRAALEAMAYGTREVSDAMQAVAGVHLESMKVDGGAARNDWLMRFLASVLEVPVARPDVVETTAFGAAGLAGLATGTWSEPAEFAACRHYHDFEGEPHLVSGFNDWMRAVEATLYWAKRGA